MRAWYMLRLNSRRSVLLSKGFGSKEESLLSQKIRIQIRKTRPQPHGIYAGLLQRGSECLRELGAAIHQEGILPAQESLFGIGEIPGNLKQL